VRLYELPLHQLRAALAAGDVSAREVATAFLDRADEVDAAVRAFITRRPREEVLAEADAVDAARSRGDVPGILAGIPVAVKDNICTAGVETTCASRILRGFVPPYDATAVVRLRQAGAILVGKTNMDEFAMGSSTEHSAFFPTANPWDLGRVPGGSSGGSAAVVAAGMAAAALGSDTGGSIRQPAAFCGVVGLKPTYGRVSRYGLVAFASSLDQIGPLCRDVTDAALVLGVIAGPDPHDATCHPEAPPAFSEALVPDVRGMRIGVPRELLAEGVAPEVRSAVVAALDLLAEQGAEVEECSLPHVAYALDAYYVIAPSEASSNLARYDGVRFGWRAAAAEDYVGMYRRTRGEGFGPEVRRRIMLGTYALSAGYYEAYYDRAQRVRTLICREFAAAFQRFDVLVSPTAPTTAFAFGEKTGDPLAMYLSDVCTIPANLAGLPAVSVPCGFANGLPVGLQIMAPAFAEGVCLRVAYTFEQASDYHRRRPPAPALPAGGARGVTGA
jgi:aspartyl-tRNA(Asn)/glutamyl-tRNA(Gln) amidotransferase subunit A